MKIFEATGYHSTRQKGLKKFADTTEDIHIDTGEGAHVHGYGLYLQSSKELNVKNYKDSLSYGSKKYNVATIDGTKLYHSNRGKTGWYSDFSESEMIIAPDTIESMVLTTLTTSSFFNNVDGVIRECEKRIRNGSLESERYQKAIEYMNSHDISVTHEYEKGASQYEVIIPDYFVLLEEDESADNYPELALDVFHNYGIASPNNLNTLIEERIELLKEKYPQISDEDARVLIEYFNKFGEHYSSEIGEIYDKYKLHSEENNINRIIEMRNVRTISTVEGMIKRLESLIGGKQTMMYLIEHGYNGLHYYGGFDGECWVIYTSGLLEIKNEE